MKFNVRKREKIMVQIPVVNNYKEYLLTDKGVEVIYKDGTRECLVANRTFKEFLSGNNLSLSKHGKIIKNKKKVNEKPKPSNKSTVKPKARAVSATKTKPKAKAVSATKTNKPKAK
jgi:hypothetical protein